MHHPPKLRAMLEDLIALPTVSSVKPELNMGNRHLINRLAEWLADAGYRVEILELPDQPDKANLIATLGTGPGGLVLSGHTDTVPYDAGRWTRDPFAITEDGGKLYGLGTSDMKSFLALALEVARGLKSQDLRQPLTILATADEESSMSGARALVQAGRPLGRHAIIGEPTSLRRCGCTRG